MNSNFESVLNHPWTKATCQRLRDLQKLEFPRNKDNLIDLLRNPQDISFCKSLLWKTVCSIFRQSQGRANDLVQCLIGCTHFGTMNDLLEKLLELPREWVRWPEVFSIINYEHNVVGNPDNAATMFVSMFENMTRQDKTTYIPMFNEGHLINSTVFRQSKEIIWAAKRVEFDNPNIKSEKVLEILEDRSVLFGNQELVEIMIPKIDYLVSEKDATILIRYAKTLLDNNHVESDYYQSSHPEIVQPILNYVNSELAKEHKELSKLQLAFELLNSFVDYKSIDDFDFRLIRGRIDTSTGNVRQLQYCFSMFTSKRNQNIAIPMTGVFTENQAVDLLMENKRLSFRTWNNDFNSSSHVDDMIEKLIDFDKYIDSYFRLEIHTKILYRLVEENNRRILINRLKTLRDANVHCLELLKNWMNLASSSYSLIIASRFMSLLVPNEEIATIFLSKIINSSDLQEAINIRNYFLPTHLSVLETAGVIFVKMESSRDILRNVNSNARFFGIMEIWALFLGRKEFNEFLLMKIDFLQSNDPITKARYELTLAR